MVQSLKGSKNNLSSAIANLPNYVSKVIKSFYNEIVYGPGTKHLFRVLISPSGLLGIFFLIISFFLSLIPQGTAAYYQAQTLINILWFVFFYMALAESWNIIGGYAGEIDFGHVLFAGMGIFTEAILINEYNAMTWFSFLGNNDLFNIYLPLAVTIIISGLSAVFVALIIGVPLLRLKGAYFAISMLAFSQVLMIIFLFIDIPFYKTNLGTGVNVGHLVTEIPNYNFVVFGAIIVVSIVAYVIVHYVSYTRLGLALRAIKGSPDGASSIGINVLKTKLQAFAISGFIAGIAGAVYMIKLLDVTPDVAFNVNTTVEMIIMTLLGGSASVFGPVIGALIIWPIRSILSTSLSGVSFNINLNLIFFNINGALNFSVAYLIIYGLIFVLAVLYLPKGIIGFLEDKKILKRESLISEEDIKQLRSKGSKLNE